MSFKVPQLQFREQPRVRWQAAAFLIETMMLLFFIMISLAVLTAMFAQSAERSVKGEDLSRAVSLATSAAERFAADPTSLAEQEERGDYVVVSDVEQEKRAAGSLYNATISVYKQADPGGEGRSSSPIYQISTSSYRSEV